MERSDDSLLKRRYAIYWTPEPSHPLWHAGCAWLGRDPSDDGKRWPLREATDQPRRYGFHATLKAPFALREPGDEERFLDAVRDFASRTPCFAMPALVVGCLGLFVALRPAQPVEEQHPLRRLADACVTGFDHWRAAPNREELEERSRSTALDEEQLDLLQRWGYPYGFEHWRFHMTLSNPLRTGIQGDGLRRRLLDQASNFFAQALRAPLACESLCVFVEPEPQQPFVLARRFALAS